MNGQVGVLETIVDGVAKHKGAQLVVSIGDQLDPEDIRSVAGNAIIVKKAPELELLQRASDLHY